MFFCSSLFFHLLASRYPSCFHNRKSIIYDPTHDSERLHQHRSFPRSSFYPRVDVDKRRIIFGFIVALGIRRVHLIRGPEAEPLANATQTRGFRFASIRICSLRISPLVQWPGSAPPLILMPTELLGHVCRQLEELQLIQCSLLPGELLTFIDIDEPQAGLWNSLLDTYSEISINSETPGTCAHFRIQLSGFTKVWFDIELSHAYPEKTDDSIILPMCLCKGRRRPN